MKILIRTPNWLGDVVMAVPALRRLRATFPEARIDLFSAPWVASVLENSKLFDGNVSLEGKELGKTVATSRRLRDRRYDLGILFTNSFSSAFLMRLTGSNRRLGYATDGRGFLLTDRVEAPEWKDRRHQVFYYLNLVREAARIFGRGGSSAQVDDGSLSLSSASADDADAFLSNLGVPPDRPLIVFGAGSANSEAKRWPPQNFAGLGDRFRIEYGASIVLLGSGSDHGASDGVAAASKRRPIDLTGQTDIARAAGILHRATAVVSNDMGLAHLSAALGTPTFVIFGPTDPETTRPFSEHARVISAGVECSPCMLRECPIDHRCMTRVTPDGVFAEVAAALAISR